VDWLNDPHIWASLLSLTALEIVLGIDVELPSPSRSFNLWPAPPAWSPTENWREAPEKLWPSGSIGRSGTFQMSSRRREAAFRFPTACMPARLR
jgi:hypothetical protein